MNRINRILFTIAALGFAQGAAAVQPLEINNAIVIEAEDPLATDQLIVTGRNFDNGEEIQLTLGGTPLPVLEHTATVILAEIPADVLPGNYVLVVWSGGGSVHKWNFGSQGETARQCGNGVFNHAVSGIGSPRCGRTIRVKIAVNLGPEPVP